MVTCTALKQTSQECELRSEGEIESPFIKGLAQSLCHPSNAFHAGVVNAPFLDVF
jgi:hypothetical protein